ncbi:MAG: hypothetical protein ACK41V_16590 [Acidovorax sp.]|uniref:hypothetical protein n=1 Tax=Acidovorax sp. TaxID=1872122 RepID=UPI00391BD9CB
MASEFFITFEDAPGYIKQKNKLIENAKKLPTFRKIVGVHQLQFKDSSKEGWEYDVRLFFEPTNIVIEVSESSQKVYADMKIYIENIRKILKLRIIDEDGGDVNFFSQ